MQSFQYRMPRSCLWQVKADLPTEGWTGRPAYGRQAGWIQDPELKYNASVAELVDALDSKSSVFGRVGSIPTRGTNKPQKSGNTSELQKGARFFFEAKRSVFFCGFQSERVGKLAFWQAIPPRVLILHSKHNFSGNAQCFYLKFKTTALGGIATKITPTWGILQPSCITQDGFFLPCIAFMPS